MRYVIENFLHDKGYSDLDFQSVDEIKSGFFLFIYHGYISDWAEFHINVNKLDNTVSVWERYADEDDYYNSYNISLDDLLVYKYNRETLYWT